MRRILALGAICAFAASAEGPYKILRTAKVGGDGGFDYVYADSAGRRLYIARSGPGARITAFNLDTLESAGEIAHTNGHGVAVDAKTGHGFASSKPVAMWDSKTLAPIKTIDVDGGPDGIMQDPFNNRIWVFSHRAPHATVINASDGSIAGTLDLGGAPEQAASDGKGHIYVDIEDKDSVAVVDAAALKVTAHYEIGEHGKTPAGLALDAKNHILFVACRNPATMVIVNAKDGKYITSLPIGAGVDGAGFNPATKEAFSSQGDGTLTVIREKNAKTFEVEQTVKTMPGAKTMTIDSKTNRVLLIAAEYGPPPPPSATPPAGGRGRGGRGPMLPGSFSIIEVGK